MKRSLALLPLFALLAGCQGPTLVGSWTSELTVEVAKVPVTLDIKPDGTWTGAMKTEGFSLPGFEVPSMSATSNGTWKVEGDTLTFSATKANVLDAPPIVKAFQAGLEDKLKTELNKWGSAKIKFPDDKSVELTLSNGGAATLTRVTKA